jgi:hypothetical protein
VDIPTNKNWIHSLSLNYIKILILWLVIKVHIFLICLCTLYSVTFEYSLTFEYSVRFEYTLTFEYFVTFEYTVTFEHCVTYRWISKWRIFCHQISTQSESL